MKPITSPHRQRGIAAVLLVILVGLGMSAILAGSLHHQQGQQEMVETLRGNSESQLRAWTGVDLVKDYVAGLTTAQLDSLEASGAPLTLSGDNTVLNNAIAARLLKGEAGDGQIRAEITGRSGEAKTTIEVVYALGGSTPATNDEAVTFNGNLNLSGEIKISGANGGKLHVDGRVTAAGSLSGVTELNATGDITLSGAPTGQLPMNLWSNGTIDLRNGDYQNIRARQSIILGSGTTAGLAHANVKVTTAGTSVEKIRAKEFVDITNGGTYILTSIHTLGSITTSSGKPIPEVLAEKNIKNTAGNELVISNGKIGGRIDGRVRFLNGGAEPGYTLPGWQDVPAFSINKLQIQVDDFKHMANYRFYLDRDDTSTEIWHRIRVDVKNVGGIPDGIYRFGKAAQYDWNRNLLCSSINSKNECSSPSYLFCNSEGPGCINAMLSSPSSNSASMDAVDQALPMWTLSTPSQTSCSAPGLPGASPGVYFFEGNLKLSGILHSAILVTGNLLTTSNASVWSLTKAGANSVCNENQFSGGYLKNFCSADKTSVPKNQLSSIALQAGNLDTGGKIRLATNNCIKGAVNAGATLVADGSTKIYGPVRAAGQRYTSESSQLAPNNLGASTLIVVSEENGSGNGGGNGGSTGAGGFAKILWARYK